MSNLKLEEKWVNTKTGKIYYYSNCSIQNRTTVVFLHGLASNHTTWLDMAENFFQHGYNCIIPDLRGHGNSDKTKKKNFYKISVLSDDLEYIFRQENVGDIILVGYSFGGAVALEYAYHGSKKISDLILISTNHANPLQFTKWKIFIRPIIWILSLFAGLIFWQKRKTYHYYHPQEATGYWRSVWLGFQTMPWSVNIWLLLEMAKLNFYKRKPLVDLPVLIIYSKHDPFLSEKELNHMAKILPKAKIVASKNNSHFIATKSQNETSYNIINYLKRI